jgi:hypothetical protein
MILDRETRLLLHAIVAGKMADREHVMRVLAGAILDLNDPLEALWKNAHHCAGIPYDEGEISQSGDTEEGETAPA